MRTAAAWFLPVLLLGGCLGGSKSGFPDRYILNENELPAGLKLSPADSMLSSKNPGPLNKDFLQGVLAPLGLAGHAPKEAWVELVENRSEALGGMMMVAGYWPDVGERAAALAAAQGRLGTPACDPPGNVTLFSDDHVIVVFNGDDELQPRVHDLAAALRAKTSALAPVCR